MSKGKYKLSWQDKILINVSDWMLRLIFMSSRKKITGEEHLKAAVASDQPVFIALWHGRMLFTAWAMRKYNVVTLISDSRDGEIIARIVGKWGLRSIRGSSSRGSRQALREMAETMAQPDSVLGITMDGPKGPRHVAKPGSLNLAIKKNALVIPTSGTSTRAKTFTKSWDHYQVPMPFGTVYVRFGAPLVLAADLDESEVAQLVGDAVIKLEQSLDDLVS